MRELPLHLPLLALLICGLSLAFSGTAAVAVAEERVIERLASHSIFIPPDLFGGFILAAFIAIYAGWVWLIVPRRNRRAGPQGFEMRVQWRSAFTLIGTKPSRCSNR